MDSGLCKYHLFVWSNLNFLLNSLWITFPTQTCLILLLCTNLLHSLNMWLVVSSLSPHKLHLQFCVFLSIFTLKLLFCVAIRRDSVSLLLLPFLSHDQIFSYEISLVCRLKCPYSCFSFYFCLLVIFVLLMLVWFVLFMIAVNSFPLHYYNHYLLIRVFTSALADGFSLVFERWQVSSRFQDFFQCSSNSQ